MTDQTSPESGIFFTRNDLYSVLAPIHSRKTLMKKIRLGIVEDNHKTREHIIARMSLIDSFSIVMICGNGEDALQELEKKDTERTPEVILMDIGLPGISGIETTIMIKERYPEIKILMQTIFEDTEHIFRAIQAGACGYLLKDDPIEVYQKTIEEIMKEGASITPAIAQKVFSYVRETNPFHNSHDTSKISLTNRETDILRLIVDDLTEEEIGNMLFISPHTVRTHIKNIYKKLHVHSRVSAVKAALTQRLL